MAHEKLTSLIKSGKIPEIVVRASEGEPLSPVELSEKILAGTVVVTYSPNHPAGRPVAIGDGTKIKVNANIGTSSDSASIEKEVEKLNAAVRAGADTVMDLSTGPEIRKTRQTIIELSPIPVGTVPLYEAARLQQASGKGFVHMSPNLLFDVIEQHGEDGVAFITVHCGVTQKVMDRLKKTPRLLGIVSRGGAFSARWMEYNKKENPLYEEYDRLLEIAGKYDMTLSLGDGLRPGCLADASDQSQLEELSTLGELTARAREKGVQVMVEGPGHVPLDQVEANVKIQKTLCKGAPFYVLGPLVTDLAAGHDHIACAIGGALAGKAGADFLCYVTASEHLRLPDADDVYEGVIASRIAAHAADIAKGLPGARELDDRMARARKELDWKTQLEIAIDSEKAHRLRESAKPSDAVTCTMCGEFCAIKVLRGE